MNPSFGFPASRFFSRSRKYKTLTSAFLIVLILLSFSIGTVGATTVGGDTAPDCSTVTYTGNGTEQNPYEVSNIDELQCIENQGVGANYTQVSDIDASSTSEWNGGDGFNPIGDSVTQFTGKFDGSGFTVTGLYVNRSRSSVNGTGLFGRTGLDAFIRNVGLENASVSNPNTSNIGGLVGIKEGGVINNSYTTGNVSGSDSGSASNVGGLIGRNDGGSVSESHSTVNVSVSGFDSVGGLVGRNNGGTVRDSYATGSVFGFDSVGGLVGTVGVNAGRVESSYATGSAEGFSRVGGLIGRNLGSIDRSYATGTVSGSTEVGGIIGQNGEDAKSFRDGVNGSLRDSYWDVETTFQSKAIGKEGGEDTQNHSGGESILKGDVSGFVTDQITGDDSIGNMTPFDFTDTWDVDVGGDGSYPFLRNNTQIPSPVPTLDGDGSDGASSVTVESPPQDTTAGKSIKGPPRAKVTDSSGNPVSGVNVTVTEEAGETFDSGKTTVSTNSSGIATFDDLFINTSAVGYQLSFLINSTDPNVSSSSSVLTQQFNVSSNKANSVMIFIQPQDSVVGEPIRGFAESPEVVVTDSFDNPVSGVDVAVSEEGEYAFDNGTTTVQTDPLGIANFSDLYINTSDTEYQLNFSIDNSDSNVSSGNFSVSQRFSITGENVTIVANALLGVTAPAGGTGVNFGLTNSTELVNTTPVTINEGDENATATFVQAPLGSEENYTVIAGSPRYATENTTVPGESDSFKKVNLTLIPQRVSVTAEASLGVPAPEGGLNFTFTLIAPNGTEVKNGTDFVPEGGNNPSVGFLNQSALNSTENYTVTVNASGYQTDGVNTTTPGAPGGTEFADFGFLTREAFFNTSILSTNSPVVEGEEINFTVNVENTGSLNETQTINLTTLGGTEVDNTTLSLNSSEDKNVTLRWDTEVGDNGSYTPNASFPDTNDSVNVTVLKKPVFETNITETNSPVTEGKDLLVNGTVTNIGEEDGMTQQVNLTNFEGELVGSETFTLNGSESKAFNFTWNTEAGDNSTGEVTVSSEDASDKQTVTVEEEASFDVDIIGTNSPVTEGDILDVNINVTNTGDGTATQPVNLTDAGFNKDIQDTVEVTLLGGESNSSITVQWDTSLGDNGTGEIRVLTRDDTDTESVRINRTAFFDVNITETNSPVVEGKDLLVNGTVENTGDVADTQKIDLNRFDGTEVDNSSFTLSGGDSKAFNFTWSTKTGENATDDVEVSSKDDTDTETVTVGREAIFSVNITETNAPVLEGEKLHVNGTVENLGDGTDTQEISLLTFSGNKADNSSFSLSGGDSKAFNFTWSIEAGNNGTGGVTVSGQDDTDTETVTVLELADLEVIGVNPNDPVVGGEKLMVDITVDNTGDVAKETDFLLEIGGTEKDKIKNVTVNAGSQVSRTLNYTTKKNDPPEVDVTGKETADGTSLTVPADVQEPSDVRVTDVTPNDPVVEGNVLNVSITVENTGGVSEETDIVLTVEGTEKDRAKKIKIPPSGNVTRVLSYTTTTNDPPGVNLTGTETAENTNATERATVLEKPFFDVNITETNASVVKSAGVSSSTDSSVVEGEKLTANVTVTNTGDTQDSQRISLTDIDDNQFDEQIINLLGGESKTITLLWQTDIGDAGNRVIVAQSANNSDTETVVIEEATPRFSVEITDTNSPVLEGNDLRVTANITNTGDIQGTQNITLTGFDGERRDTVRVGLTEGTTDRVTLSWGTVEGDNGEGQLTVLTENDTATNRATVQEAVEPPQFDVRITDVEDTEEGDSMEVNVTVENTGEKTGVQNIALLDPDSVIVDSINLRLSGGSTSERTLEWSTEAGDAGDNGLTVRSNNDSDREIGTVQRVSGVVVDFFATPRPEPTVNDSVTLHSTLVNTADVEIEKRRWYVHETEENLTGEKVNPEIPSKGNYTVTHTVVDEFGRHLAGLDEFLELVHAEADVAALVLADEREALGEAGEDRHLLDLVAAVQRVQAEVAALGRDALEHEVVVTERLRPVLGRVLGEQALLGALVALEQVPVLFAVVLEVRHRGLLEAEFFLGGVDDLGPVAVEELHVLGLLVHLGREVHLVLDVFHRASQRHQVLGDGLLAGGERPHPAEHPLEGEFTVLLDHLDDPRPVLREVDLVGVPVSLDRVAEVTVALPVDIDLALTLLFGVGVVHDGRRVAL